MNIELIIHHELDPNSGAAGTTLQIAQCFRKLGHDARIYSFTDLPPTFSPRTKQLLFPLFVARHLARAQRRRNLDVVDASTGDTWLWALLDPARRRTLLVATSQGLEHTAVEARRESSRRGELDLSWKFPLYYGGLHLREVELTLRRADLAFFVNRYDRDYAVERLGVDPTRTRVVWSGIRDALLGLPLEPTPLERSASIRIAQLGSYLPQKGVRYGAQALSATLGAHPQSSVTFLGTGCEPQVVLGDFDPSLHDRIAVLPRYENSELPRHLAGHSIALFPTLSEGFGNSLLEAMACGLAPVSTATPGPREFVRPDENGLLVPTRDADALSQALTRLISDRQLLDRLRRNAHDAAQKYTGRASAQRRLECYQDAISRRA